MDHAVLGADNALVHADEMLRMDDEPDHQEPCAREQAYLLRAIQADVDLTDPMNDAVSSLRFVLAADESIRTKQVVPLDETQRPVGMTASSRRGADRDEC